MTVASCGLGANISEMWGIGAKGETSVFRTGAPAICPDGADAKEIR